MHCSEVERLAAGQGGIRDLAEMGAIAGTITFRHKTGQPKIISLDAQALAAARRLQVRGSAPSRHTVMEAGLLAAKKHPGVIKIDFGALRHSFATWLLERGSVFHPKGTGLPIEMVAEALGHTSSRTTALLSDGGAGCRFVGRSAGGSSPGLT
jgi:integrase